MKNNDEKIVEVVWEDITTHNEVPSSVKEYECMLGVCRDFGILLHKDKKIIVLAHHRTHIKSFDEDAGETHDDIIVIPLSVVKKINVLRSGKE